MTGRITALLAGLALLGAGPAAAQTSQLANASVTIPDVLSINLTNASINFGTATEADLDAGVMSGPITSTLVHRGNKNHIVQIEATTAAMQNGLVGNPTVKPTTDLQLSVDGGTNWMGVPAFGSPGTLITAARGSYTVTVQYQMNVGYTEEPDTYSLAFNYTIVAN